MLGPKARGPWAMPPQLGYLVALLSHTSALQGAHLVRLCWGPWMSVSNSASAISPTPHQLTSYFSTDFPSSFLKNLSGMAWCQGLQNQTNQGSSSALPLTDYGDLGQLPFI